MLTGKPAPAGSPVGRHWRGARAHCGAAVVPAGLALLSEDQPKGWNKRPEGEPPAVLEAPHGFAGDQHPLLRFLLSVVIGRAVKRGAGGGQGRWAAARAVSAEGQTGRWPGVPVPGMRLALPFAFLTKEIIITFVKSCEVLGQYP